MNFIERFFDKRVRRTLKRVRREKEEKKRQEEYKKLITLTDLKNYVELTEKISGEIPTVIRITKKQFERYKGLTFNYLWNFEYPIRDDSRLHFRGIFFKIIEKEEK